MNNQKNSGTGKDHPWRKKGRAARVKKLNLEKPKDGDQTPVSYKDVVKSYIKELGRDVKN